MNIKHTHPNTKEIIIHEFNEGTKRTKCGEDTTYHPSHWTKTNEKVTCENCKR